jgi:hypothetical protein
MFLSLICPETGLSSLLWSVIRFVIPWPNSVYKRDRSFFTQPHNRFQSYTFIRLYTHISFFNATLLTISAQLKILLKLKLNCCIFLPYLAILRQIFNFLKLLHFIICEVKIFQRYSIFSVHSLPYICLRTSLFIFYFATVL